MFDADKNLVTLKTLADTLSDSINGYRDASEHVQSSEYRELFTTMVGDREAALNSLNGVIMARGAEGETNGTTLGHLHQSWLNFKASLTGRDDKAIINEVERGEDYLKGKFEEAMKLEDLDSSARTAIDDAYASVREGHDRVSVLKHQLEASA
ncbi:MAG TPA: PA2169 family four-helix-bundle protein [Sphingomonas sp.]|nr:PA2169 family four-helix-bundle protein [Sphingomonas sp.]